MTNRAETLTRLRSLVDHGDEKAILDHQALLDAAGLVLDAGTVLDLDLLDTLAWLHWRRYQLLLPGQDEADLELSQELFALLSLFAPLAVPEPMRVWLDENTVAATALPLPHHYAPGMAGLALSSGHAPLLGPAVDLCRTAAGLLPDDHPDRGTHLGNLCVCLRLRFAVTGATADLAEAITAGRTAIATTGEHHPNRAFALGQFGAVLVLGSQFLGADRTEAIDVLRLAATIPSDAPAIALMFLGMALRVRAEATGSLADLDGAAEA